MRSPPPSRHAREVGSGLPADEAGAARTVRALVLVAEIAGPPTAGPLTADLVVADEIRCDGTVWTTDTLPRSSRVPCGGWDFGCMSVLLPLIPNGHVPPVRPVSRPSHYASPPAAQLRLVLLWAPPDRRFTSGRPRWATAKSC